MTHTDYTPVIEHFELSAHYLEAFNYLQTSLRDKISNPATLETLATKFHHCFIETVERCVLNSQNMPYTNRSNKRNEPARIQSTQSLISRKPRGTASRPDSGVVIDDTSEESGSIIGSSSLCHRDSVRTVTSYAGCRGSNIAPKGNADVFPTPLAAAGVNQSPAGLMPAFEFGGNMDMTPASVSAVEQWASGLSFNQNDGTFTTDQWMTPQAGFGLDEPLLYQHYCTMDDTFTNLHDTKNNGAI
jgi:hypothetical protein